MERKDSVVLIPSLEPDDRLPAYIDRLKEHGLERIIVVDDGSGDNYRGIFDDIASREGVTVLTHPVNRGKGAALRTGYEYLMRDKPCAGVITADADGQHTAEDVAALADALAKGGESVLLGVRDFSQKGVPWKSFCGNRLTTFFFFLASGRWVTDTQTGLRAFPASLLQYMTEIDGDRYEYEMNVLLCCARDRIPFVTLPITTVYENNNEGSHFHPFRDSWRIYKIILRQIGRFLLSSVLSTVLDFLICFLLYEVLRPLFAVEATKELVAMVIARVASATFNFFLNKDFVFKVKKGGKHALLKFFALCVGVFLAQFCMLRLLHGVIGIGERLATVIGNVIIFFPNYHIQQHWIFGKNEKEKNA